MAGVPIPGRNGISLFVSASDLLDRRHREFVGSPEIGRLLMTRLRAVF
jgi:hypothetical protein